MEILCQVGSIDFVGPQRGEYFIDIESVLELGIELMGRSSHCNVAIESDHAVGQVVMCDLVCLEYLVHDARFGFVQKVKHQLHEVTRHVGVR